MGFTHVIHCFHARKQVWDNLLRVKKGQQCRYLSYGNDDSQEKLNVSAIPTLDLKVSKIDLNLFLIETDLQQRRYREDEKREVQQRVNRSHGTQPALVDD